jgi:hypothetical protein
MQIQDIGVSSYLITSVNFTAISDIFKGISQSLKKHWDTTPLPEINTRDT